jgi:UDP-glucose 4-epimerase
MELKGKKVVVTGGSGFIGGHLMDAIKKEKPYSLTNVDLDQRYDLTKIGKITAALEGKDVVFHLATLPLISSLTNPYLVANEIYSMGLVLCELCRQGVFKTLIIVSSSEAYGSAKYEPMDEKHPLDPTTPYAAAKASADLVALSYFKTFGIDLAIARPFNNYGPRQPLLGVIPKTIESCLKGKNPIVNGDGEQIRDFIYVKDTVQAIIDVYRNQQTRGKVINIASNNPVKIYDLVCLIMELSGFKGRVQFEDARVSDVKVHYADITLAKMFINLKPQYTIEKGLKETIAWYQKYLK